MSLDLKLNLIDTEVSEISYSAFSLQWYREGNSCIREMMLRKIAALLISGNY